MSRYTMIIYYYKQKGNERKLQRFWLTAKGQFYLLSYWLTAGIRALPSSFSIPFKNFPEAFKKPLGISKELSYTLIEVSSVCPTVFKSFPAAIG
jgi:hypothetical protein